MNITIRVLVGVLISSIGFSSNADDYWTKENMESAVPMQPPFQVDKEGNIVKTTHSRVFKTQSESSVSPSRADVNVNPYDSGGRLFFIDADGKRRSCTAQFTGANVVLLTAAHCIYDYRKARYYTDLYFVLGYKDGIGRRFRIQCMRAAPEYINRNGDLGYDYAFLRTTVPFTGPHIGLKLYVTERNLVTAIGYPGNIEHGQYMQAFTGNVTYRGSKIIKIDNNPMGNGSSGGAWITEFSDGFYYAIGLNSFHDSRNSMIEWSPQFDDETQVLFDDVWKHSDCN